MLNTPRGETTAGFMQGALYNWHKPIGLVGRSADGVLFAEARSDAAVGQARPGRLRARNRDRPDIG